VTLKDVVLDTRLQRKVREIVQAIGLREQVLENWGFSRSSRVGHGFSALFHGASGTGKTLTAEAIAGEMGLPLRVVTAPNLVSRYVGETDHNVATLFESLLAHREILLVDEADALLGERVHATTSTDHYYNMHVNTFLTLLDTHPGVVFFSTNKADQIDSAFDRRIRWKLEFSLPDEEARLRIWRLAIPEEAPLDPGVDFRMLAARYSISGGLIRNAVLQAAYTAAAEGRSIRMEDLGEAAESEMGYRGSRTGVIGFRARGSQHECMR
jgi:SpoVK/Ycf46/Vps4 family AAA+-type ATPase